MDDMTDPTGRTRWSPEGAMAVALQIYGHDPFSTATPSIVDGPPEILGRDMYAALGEATPAQAPFTAVPNPFYHYHKGDFFTPGAAGWVLDQRTETPLMAIWGNGLLLRPNRGMPVYGTRADNLPPEPLQAPFLRKVATPWGAGIPWTPGAETFPASFEVSNAGGLTLSIVDFPAGVVRHTYGSSSDEGRHGGDY